MTSKSNDLFWMKDAAIFELNASIEENLKRYREGDFSDLAVDVSWNVKSLLKYDASAFEKLKGESGSELDDALIIYSELRELPPRLATCMNVWVRLCHTELLPFARKRWLKEKISDAALIKLIEDHFFKAGVGGYRDDNAAGRPWWTGYIGSRIARSNDTSQIRSTMAPFMRTTDTRSSVIERSGLFSECNLAKQISNYLNENKLPNEKDEKTFRKFLKSINLRSNGLYFGDFSQGEVYTFLDHCR